MIIINIARDFSDTPGARHISDGPFSGQQFRDEILIPKYKEACEKGEMLQVNLDGCYGFATSFLEESFGGLVREIKEKGVERVLEIISNDDRSLPTLIHKYIMEAEEKL